MKTTVTEHDFQDAFHSLRPENFTYDGLKALWEYLEELDQQSEVEIDFDVIAICCEYSEYGSFEELQADYDAETYPTIESFQDNTTVIEVDGGGYIIASF